MTSLLTFADLRDPGLPGMHGDWSDAGGTAGERAATGASPLRSVTERDLNTPGWVTPRP
ncbi:hypothetical protein [Streptomyces sp. NPDC002221]|uniref:hypothetical protein n=1 Tax=Streptomyces sp. NPDC002221 TaxID=3364639 RepID=UPI00369943C6